MQLRLLVILLLSAPPQHWHYTPTHGGWLSVCPGAELAWHVVPKIESGFLSLLRQPLSPLSSLASPGARIFNEKRFIMERICCTT